MQTLTTNGELAFSTEYFLQDTQKSLAAMNNVLVTKDNFPQVIPYLDNIMNSNQIEIKVNALILLVHFRDIEKGKGLRNPFIQGILHIYPGHKQFVHDLIKLIPKYGYYKDLCRLYSEADMNQYEELKSIIVDFYASKLNQEHIGKKIENCAKFAPRERKKYHKFSLDLAERLFPESSKKLKDYRRYLQEIFQNYEQITEVLMCSGEWDKIDPKFVPSLCFQKYKKAFIDPKEEKKNDKRKLCRDQFATHIKKAIEGKDGCKINAKRVFVNEIIQQITSKIYQDYEEFSEEDKIMQNAILAQLKDIIEDVRKNGKMFNENISVMVDVSGSMNGIPMNVAIGLGLIISQLNNDTFGQKVMTFTSDPTWVDLSQYDTYIDKIKGIMQAPWGMNTDFFKAVKLLVDTADNEERIPKILFILSDMQFDQADSQAGKKGTGYDRICQLFDKHGYSRNSIPVIVFWNLRGKTDNFVVDTQQKGVICLAGYSQSLLKSILNAPDVDHLRNLEPFSFLVELLNSERYKQVKEIAQNSFKQI